MNRMKLFCTSMFLMIVFFLVACTPQGTIDYEAVFLAAQAEVDLAPTVNDDFILPTSVEVEGQTVTITWVSSHPNVISIAGSVNRPDHETGDVTVTLTATFALDDETHEHDFMVVVEALAAVTFTVSFYDGDELLDTKIVNAGSKVTPPSEPTPEAGYVFGGWFTDETLDEMWDFDLDLVNANLSLYANWDLMTYTITYMDLNGAVHTNPAHFNITTPDHTLTDATRNGYEFVGWYTALEGGIEVTTLTFDEASNIILYARFEAQSYTITYDNLQSTTHDNPATYNIETATITLLDPTERTGYAFVGWFTEITEGSEVESIVLGSTGDMTLYARWSTIDYTITYNNLQGTTHDNPATYNIETATITLLDPTDQLGYTFVGWFDALVDGNEVTTIDEGSTGNKTVYARWTTNSYSITYLGLEGATQSNPNGFNIETPTITLSAPSTRTGYVFDGWFNAEVEGTEVLEITLGSTGNLTLYARWVAIEYDITYELGDGMMVGTSIDTYTIETPTFDLPSAELEDQAFMGWFDALDGGNLIESVTLGSTGDLTLYARFSPYYDVYYYGQKNYQAQKLEAFYDNEIMLTTDGLVLTRGEGSLGLIGNGSFDGQSEFVNITPLFLLEPDEIIIDIDLYGEIAIALSSEGRIFIWGYINFNQQALYANQPVDITIQFNFAPGEVPTQVASFSSFSLIFTNLGVHRFEHEEAYQLSAPVANANFSWGMIFGFGEFTVSLSYRLGDEIFLYDPYLNKDFVNVTNVLNLPSEQTIQAVFAQDTAVHVIMEDSYHFAQFIDNTGVPLAMQVPVTIAFNLDEVVVDVFGGGVILTSEGRLLVPEFVNADESEIPEMIIYTDVTAEFNLNENETISHLFDPMFVMTSEGRFFVIGSNETEAGSELAFFEIDLTALLQPNEVLLDVLANNILMFKTNLGLYEVGFGEQGLILQLIEASSLGIVHHEVLVLADFDPYVYTPEDPMFKAFDGWYLDEALTILWTYELTTDNMVLYPGFVDTHYMIYLNIFGNHEPYYVPLDEIPNMPDPMIEHFEFIGWYYMNDENNYVEFMFDEVLKAGTILDAYLSPVEYQLTIILNEEVSDVINVVATTMYANVDFQIFSGYEITGVYIDEALTIPLNMEAMVLSNLTLYVTYEAEAIPVYYYQDMVDVTFDSIFEGGNQFFGTTTTGQFVVSGSNYDGGLGIGMNDVDDLGFVFVMSELLNFMPEEVVVEMSNYGSRKAILTSEGRVFVWGYYRQTENNYELVGLATDITSELNVGVEQHIVDIYNDNLGLFVFLNDGTIKYFDYQYETISTFTSNLVFDEILTLIVRLNEYYMFDGDLTLITQQGIYEISFVEQNQDVIVDDLSTLTNGDTLIFVEMNFMEYLSYHVYSAEGRRYSYNAETSIINENYDLDLNENEYITGVYNVSWDTRAFITSDHRLLTYDTIKSEISLGSLDPNEYIVGFYMSADFITNHGRTGYLDILSKQILFNGQAFDLGERVVVGLVNFGWEFGFRLDDNSIIGMSGEVYTKTMGTNLIIEDYFNSEPFNLLTPEPLDGYTFNGWYTFGSQDPYMDTPSGTTFLFARWDEII